MAEPAVGCAKSHFANLGRRKLFLLASRHLPAFEVWIVSPELTSERVHEGLTSHFATTFRLSLSGGSVANAWSWR